MAHQIGDISFQVYGIWNISFVGSQLYQIRQNVLNFYAGVDNLKPLYNNKSSTQPISSLLESDLYVQVRFTSENVLPAPLLPGILPPRPTQNYPLKEVNFIEICVKLTLYEGEHNIIFLK